MNYLINFLKFLKAFLFIDCELFHSVFSNKFKDQFLFITPVSQSDISTYEIFLKFIKAKRFFNVIAHYSINLENKLIIILA